MKNETTNGVSQSKIRACLAIEQAAEKEFNPYRNTELLIREYHNQNGVIEIKAFDNKDKISDKVSNKTTEKEKDESGR